MRSRSNISAGLKQNADEAERTLLGASTRITGTLKQEAEDSERTLLGASTRITGTLKQEAEEIECSCLPTRVSTRSSRIRRGRTRDVGGLVQTSA